jgi:hypothetical protein
MPDVMSGRGLSNDQTFISFMEEIDPSGWYPEMPMSHSDPNPSVEFLRSGPTLSYDISCFASTKPPFVISGSRPMLLKNSVFRDAR